MNAVIQLESDNITSSVSRQFENLDKSISTMNSKITQTAESITLEVSKKVGNDEVISKINQSAESVGIEANRINLTANDILNLIAGNTINLTSKNIVIASDNFNVDKDGNINCTNANIKGIIDSSSGNIGGWTINSEGLSNGTVFIKNDGASTIYTVADLIIIRGYIMEYKGFELSDAMIKHYDLNGDGQVTAVDYVILQNLIGISMN